MGSITLSRHCNIGHTSLFSQGKSILCRIIIERLFAVDTIAEFLQFSKVLNLEWNIKPNKESYSFIQSVTHIGSQQNGSSRTAI